MQEDKCVLGHRENSDWREVPLPAYSHPSQKACSFPWLCSCAVPGTITASSPCCFRSLPLTLLRGCTLVAWNTRKTLRSPYPFPVLLFLAASPSILPSVQLSFLPAVTSKLSLSYFGTTTHSVSAPPSPLPMTRSRQLIGDLNFPPS